MATYSSILAWEISWTEEPGGLQSMGSQKRHKSKTKQQQQRHYIQHSKSFPLTSGTRRGCPSLLFLFNTVQKAPARVSREEKERKGIQTRIDVIVQVLSHVRLWATPGTSTHQASPSFTISPNWPKLMSKKLVMTSNQLIFCCPVLLLPSLVPSIRVFSSGLVLCTR